MTDPGDGPATSRASPFTGGRRSAATPTGTDDLRGSARLRIVGWILLTTLLGLGVLVVTVRAALLGDVARAANADVEQEIEEFREFVTVGRNPETALAFTSTDALLDVYLRRQRPARGEVLLGYVRGTDEVITARQTDPGALDPYEIDQDSTLLTRLVTGDTLAGIADTPSGEMRWGRVDVMTDQASDAGGALLVTVFTERGAQRVAETTQTIIGVGTGVLILIGGIAWLVAGRILRPVRTVRQAAAQITERDLTRRIPVHGTDDVAALASTFNGMLDRLEEAFAMQRRFVDDAAHELRTPITIVYGHLELLPDDPLERQLSIDLVLDELSRMSRIVSDLLLLANAERPDFVQLEDVDAAALTLDIDAKVQVLANRRWTLTQVADGMVRVDPGRVTQAVLQLAQNAVQHTTDDSEIQLASAFHDGAEGRLLELTVRDQGPGVRPSETAVIFDRFTHGSASRPAGARPGAGLGLAIVRAIAEGHGGSAFVHNAAGKGAVFGIRVPARTPSAAAADPATTERTSTWPLERASSGEPPGTTASIGGIGRSGEARPGGPPGGRTSAPRRAAPHAPTHPPDGGRTVKILIAEDEQRISSFVEKGLRAAGYSTETAADGRTALALARTDEYDLVILDIGLPGLDGFEVLRLLRQDRLTTPVIILTARDSVRDTVIGLEGGADDYVTKPFQFAELLARVRLRLRLRDGQERSGGGEPVMLTHGDITLDLRTRRVDVDGRSTDLTAREFGLLEVFMRHGQQVLSREQILGHVWGYDFDPMSNVVDVLVRALRSKVGADRIETVRGAGYRLR